MGRSARKRRKWKSKNAIERSPTGNQGMENEKDARDLSIRELERSKYNSYLIHRIQEGKVEESGSGKASCSECSV